LAEVQAAKPSGARLFKFMHCQKTKNQNIYHEYLATKEWKNKRDLVIERESGICQGCRAEPIEHVHHSTYTHQYDELIFQLVGLCENCHRKAHFTTPSWKPWKP